MELPDEAFLTFDCTSFEIDASCKVSCDLSYAIAGPTEITCQWNDTSESAEWNSVAMNISCLSAYSCVQFK